ncbi:hypothetical protein Syun_016659 [Stephania yunnanensis]|uniref:PEP-utilising enzyme C-terminal domain-containing protein n=1 Tax=Stephania yunnanensis TaxID=152371 RepID=A0AAP0J7V2_9MAGN
MTPLPTRPAPPATASAAASREKDVRAGLEVTGPPRPPQRPGMEPPRVQGIPITLIANDTWDDALPEDLVRAAYDRLAGTRYTALMHKLKKNRVQPVYVTDEAWRRYLQSWESEDFQARSRQATENRNTEVEGLGTGPSKHGGGSVSFVTTQERLADSSETPPTVNDLYLHLHTVNHDRMTFIDTRSERFYDRLRATSGATRATPEQSVDDEAVYLNVAGESSKGRVYGLGSVGRKKRRYGAPGASTSRDAGCGAAGEFNIVAEQLRKVMEFMHQRLGMDMDEIGLAQQQPPPPPPPPPPHDQQYHAANRSGLRVSEVGLVGIVEAMSLVGVMEALAACGLGAYRDTVDDLREKMVDIDNHVGEETGPKEGQKVLERLKNLGVEQIEEIYLPEIMVPLIAEQMEFFSFGTNDLTQMTFGYSRDDVGKFLPIYLSKGILQHDPFEITNSIAGTYRARRELEDKEQWACG